MDLRRVPWEARLRLPRPPPCSGRKGGRRKEDRGELRVKEDPALRGDRPGGLREAHTSPDQVTARMG